MNIVSFAGTAINDTTNYTAYFVDGDYGLPDSPARQAPRHGKWPVSTGILRRGAKKTIRIFINGANVAALRQDLMRLFDPEDETPKQLIVSVETTGTTTVSGYVMCTTDALQRDSDGGWQVFVATLAVHGDVRWRKTTATTPATWVVNTSGDTEVVANAGEDEAYPVYTITPKTAKTGGYAYKRWVPIRWRIDEAYQRYPIDIANDSLDTAALVTAGKMQADGDDLRVWVDGVEVTRWLDGINTTTTKVWCNLSFQARQEVTTRAAIASTGAVPTIDVNEDITGFPSSGILLIDSEAFTYTGKSDALKRFTGVTRAQRGTSMAAHSAGATVIWIQHDCWIYYGNSTAATPVTPDAEEPVFRLAQSTNVSWDYFYSATNPTSAFGYDDQPLRPGQWQRETAVWGIGSTEWGGGTFGNGLPTDIGSMDAFAYWQNAGAYLRYAWGFARFFLRHPAGITSVNVTTAGKYLESPAGSGEGELDCFIQSRTPYVGWTNEYEVPVPTVMATEQSWTRNETLNTGSTHAGIAAYQLAPSIGQVRPLRYVYIAAVTVALNSSNTPTLTIGAEQANYSLRAVLANETTGEALLLTATLALDEALVVDTAAKTVTGADGLSRYAALQLVDDDFVASEDVTYTSAARRDWLRLLPGNNTLRFDETGLVRVDVAISYAERYY